MGHKHIDTLKIFASNKAKEHVGKNIIKHSDMTMSNAHHMDGIIISELNSIKEGKEHEKTRSYADAVKNESKEVMIKCERRVPLTIRK